MDEKVILICQPLKTLLPDGSEEPYGFSLHLSEPERILFYQEKNNSRMDPNLKLDGDSYHCIIDKKFYSQNKHEIHTKHGVVCHGDGCPFGEGCWLPPKYENQQNS
ncbi:hypothetical protein SDC9_67126 [bioreactor metagenome]|uniref:Uncharacterized protein n=1 Tax=bioreactor metagenome TaxID=1076179 RepID=A0A644XWV2_9ZZZZ